MSATALIIAEATDSGLHPSCRELLAAARRLAADHVVAAVAGHDQCQLVEEIGTLPLDEILVIDDPLLQNFTADGFVMAMAQLVDELQPAWVLFPPTYRSRETAPRLAARFGSCVISDCVGIHPDGSADCFVRQVFQGKMLCRVRRHGAPPRFLVPLPGAFSTDDLQSTTRGTPVITQRGVQITQEQIRTRLLRRTRTSGEAVDLDRAEVIVGVGRGIGSAENMRLVEKLAGLLGAELAATRPVCDEQWLPLQRQVGSSGQTVSPRLYLAIGISGATQHVVGMKGSGTIVAINKDPEAPIFRIADIGIVGDLFEIVPALIAQFESGIA